MSDLSYLYLKPLTWAQSIDLHSHKDEGRTRIRVTCLARNDLLLRNGEKLRDFQIEIVIIEGHLPTDHDQKLKFTTNAIGGLWFSGGSAHGYFYLKPKIYRDLWDQVRDGKADCQIDLGVEQDNDDDYPVSVVSASLTFNRKQPPVAQQARKKVGSAGNDPEREGAIRLVGLKQTLASSDARPTRACLKMIAPSRGMSGNIPRIPPEMTRGAFVARWLNTESGSCSFPPGSKAVGQRRAPRASSARVIADRTQYRSVI